MPGPTSEASLLRSELESCRAELAAARGEQEPLAEALAEERFRRQELTTQAARLAEVLDAYLDEASHGEGIPGRAHRRVVRAQRNRSQEWRHVELLRSSDLFDDAWYLLHYPRSFRSGLPPALHYLRVGASRGYNPSERFDTREYLADHPDVRKAGTNPLVHFLQRHDAS